MARNTTRSDAAASSNTGAQMTTPDILLTAYVGVVNSFGVFDKDIALVNHKVMYDNKLEFDRQVSIESAMFIADNFALLIGALVLDIDNCRDIMASAIDKEIEIDELPGSEKYAARAKLNVKKSVPSTHCMELGFTVFNNLTLSTLYQHAVLSFTGNEQTDFAERVGTYALTNDDKLILGMILSNFVYLLRAFNNNAAFFDQMIGIVSKIKANMN